MKKYEKPEIYIEKFELSQHIAACAWDMSNQNSVESCSATSDAELSGLVGINAFYDENVCSDGPIDVYCYTNDSEGFNIFNS